MLCYAVLIDGGFVKRKLGSAKTPMTAAVLERFIEALQQTAPLANHRLHRVYFYDAAAYTGEQERPLGGGKITYASTPLALRSAALHQALQRVPFVALRMGELSFRGWTVADDKLKVKDSKVEITSADLRPRIEQKGVDMRIGMDIAALTLKKIVQIIVLVTGDSDLVPAMKFARREGSQLYLVPMGHGIMQSMHEHSDVIVDVPIVSLPSASGSP